MSENIENKNDISEAILIMSKSFNTFTEILVQYQREEKKRRTWNLIQAFAVPLITILGIALTLVTKSHWEYKEQKYLLNQARINIFYKKNQETQKRIDQLLTKRDQIMFTMSNLRGRLDVIQKTCSNLQNHKHENQIDSLRMLEFNLSAYVYSITEIFDDKAKQKILFFLSKIDIDRHAACTGDIPTDDQLRKIQTQTNNLILYSVRNFENSKRNTFHQISKLMNDNAKL